MMKRLLLFSLALALLGMTAARADENVRALQNKLKAGGYFFGKVNGTFEAETAAALTRYQIRNGLPISGRLDSETAQALGVETSAAADAPPQTDPETWRRLRRDEKQRPPKIKLRKKLPGTADAPAADESETATDFTPTFTLSRERLRDYVAAFVLAGLDPEADAELEFFADRVRYFGKKEVDRAKIRRDLEHYNRRWRERRFWLAGEIEIQPPQPDGLLRVTFPLRYELQNGDKKKSGRVEKTLELEVRGDDLVIVGVDER
ncbi:MAG: peptidoglycan-binding protein [Verrucomicrobiota bacterium]|nr:peptidoglycan-binding protein [Verrucomicrobiota bacterium]